MLIDTHKYYHVILKEFLVSNKMMRLVVEAIITVTSSDFYETSPMLRGGNRGSNTAEFKSEQCLVR